ncbi:aldo/keto reductase [Streptomyces sp. NPDC051105]|uniref:aldo/keto reductase n=1 Tax=Streptomyces sp. NPDC051105 TaxID=3154843 RepID=UPI003431DB5D
MTSLGRRVYGRVSIQLVRESREPHHGTASTRRPGPDRRCPGPRPHGHERLLRRHRRDRVPGHHRPGAGAGRHPAVEYSLFERGIEHDGVLDTLKELGIGLVAYSPLGRGFLSGAITSPADFTEDDWRRTDPRFQGENFDRNLDVVREVRRIAAEKNITPGQLALAWVQRQGAVAIPGTKRRRSLEENVAATEVTLTGADLAAIEAVAPHGAVAGDRYAPEHMGTLGG